ncbi:RWD domain-containing protein 1 [Heterocephalus glaber]|uniref:RWD domain-containing protein 1 n=1 Tax=Heterocephalus glaber TaxID=10181 RepID=G5BGJ8_HETGA|nr:RWD domain-containing protein 1 [Heterocephalus glaber]
MIFTLVTAVQEKLNEIEQIKTRQEEEKKLKEKEAEEAEKQLFHGTPVTIENFLCWEAKFDAELLEIKKKWIKEDEQAGKRLDDLELEDVEDDPDYSPAGQGVAQRTEAPSPESSTATASVAVLRGF